MEKDIELTLERLIPSDAPYVHTHMLPSYGTCSGNAPGHLKSMLCGNHCVLPVADGKMAGGSAQDIYFVEFDGLKNQALYRSNPGRIGEISLPFTED